VPIGRYLADLLAVEIAGKAPGDLLFCAPEGGPLRPRNWRRRVWDPAVAATGLTGLTPHDLRHTAASLAISSGAKVKHVQRMLGHQSAAMTLDVYASLFEDDLDQLTDRQDAAISAAAAASLRPGTSSGVVKLADRRAETGP
jgi:integrase